MCLACALLVVVVLLLVLVSPLLTGALPLFPPSLPSCRVQVYNGRCVWGDDQPAIPISATFVQNKGKFSEKKLQMVLYVQVPFSLLAPLSVRPSVRLAG